MSTFVYFDASGDEVEASLPKLPVNSANVDDLDLSTERDMNAGIDYHYINFYLNSGKTISWQFFSLEKRQTAYDNILSLMVNSAVTYTTTTTTMPSSTVNVYVSGVEALVEANLVGDLDGVNTVFTVDIPFTSNSVHLTMQGQRLKRGVDYTEDVESNSITFITYAPPPEAIIICEVKPAS